MRLTVRLRIKHVLSQDSSNIWPPPEAEQVWVLLWTWGRGIIIFILQVVWFPNLSTVKGLKFECSEFGGLLLNNGEISLSWAEANFEAVLIHSLRSREIWFPTLPFMLKGSQNSFFFFNFIFKLYIIVAVTIILAVGKGNPVRMLSVVS